MKFTKITTEHGRDEKLQTVNTDCGTISIQRLVTRGEKAADCDWGLYFKNEHVADFKNLKEAKEKAIHTAYQNA